jgi:hypothetical protein
MRLDPNRATVLVTAITAALVATGTAGRRAGSQDSARTEVGDDARSRPLDEKLGERWKREAAEYRIVLKSEPETPLALRAEPILHWNNPVRGTYDGLLLLWLAGGRPAAVAASIAS